MAIDEKPDRLVVPDYSVRAFDREDIDGHDPEHPMAEIFRFTDQSPVMWHENKIGATNHPWWFYRVDHVSQWFTAMCISVLQPGEACGFHSHRDETEGPYECWYMCLEGQGQLRTEYFDTVLDTYDTAFMPTGCSHQFRNVGREPVWWMTLSTRGGHALKVDTYAIECSEDRPGYTEEYNRIMESRKARGLPTP